ncbi:hypothetical protein [Citrobacter sp. CK202]|uniref:hypothetical protein n=1 Tax=Citrobacter sp. CK202 TaxID=2985111 RepID=UPI002575C427|nr:hypothetical protein [Citrobacter sp. CK202]MDM2960378.1 hypothetical protein [Citrobacter sp. CK202]
MTTITREEIERYLSAAEMTQICDFDKGKLIAVTPEHMVDLARIALASLDDEIKLRPVGVMSESAFHRLERSESRFIALWPRPGIYLPRQRPDDGVIVYAKVEGA